MARKKNRLGVRTWPLLRDDIEAHYRALAHGQGGMFEAFRVTNVN